MNTLFLSSQGAIGEVGLVAQMAENKIDIEIAGTVQQRIASCLNVLDNLLSSKHAVVSSMVVAQKHALSKMNLIQSVLHIMGIRDLKSVSKNSTLAELGKIEHFGPSFLLIFSSVNDLRKILHQNRNGQFDGR